MTASKTQTTFTPAKTTSSEAFSLIIPIIVNDTTKASFGVNTKCNPDFEAASSTLAQESLQLYPK
jgi:hypothetical protein